MSGSLAARVREVRARAAVRSWEYRQHRRAAGVWVRLRRQLAGAEAVYAIPSEAAEALVKQGYAALPVGLELEPPRTIVWLPREEAVAIPGAREIALRMSAELLSAPCLALVPFPEGP